MVTPPPQAGSLTAFSQFFYDFPNTFLNLQQNSVYASEIQYFYATIGATSTGATITGDTSIGDGATGTCAAKTAATSTDAAGTGATSTVATNTGASCIFI